MSLNDSMLTYLSGCCEWSEAVVAEILFI